MTEQGVNAEALRNSNRVFCGLFLLIGLSAVIGGMLWLAKIERFSRTAHRAVARIDSIEVSRGARGTSRYPVYSFTDEAGGRHVKRSEFPLERSELEWEAGQLTQVLYDPADPNRSMLNHFGQMWLPPIVLTGFALAWTLVVAGVSRSKRAKAGTSSMPGA